MDFKDPSVKWEMNDAIMGFIKHYQDEQAATSDMRTKF
jgi:hypothetical protein